MGLLDNLFKPKPETGMKKIGEMHPPEEAVSLNEPPPQHRAPSFLSPKTYVPRASAQVVPPTRSHPPLEKKPVQPAEGATSADPKFIVLTLGDVLSRIPTQFLRHGMHDAKRELRFEMDDLSADIAVTISELVQIRRGGTPRPARHLPGGPLHRCRNSGHGSRRGSEGWGRRVGASRFNSHL